MIKADFIRAFSGKKLPFFQELRAKHPSALVEVTISYEEVVCGKHVEGILSISHRWMEPTEPDPDGEQLKAIKAFLNSSEGKGIELVWIDGGCMPQDQPEGSRTAEDTAAFQKMLAQVNMLFLGCRVLILLDLSYVSRFWTQFEAWASMQFATPKGLTSAVGTRNERHHIVCIQNAAKQPDLYKQALVDTWAKQTPKEAHDYLKSPDVTVTNQRDKDNQLPKIQKLDGTVQAAFEAVDGWQRRLDEASAQAAARAAAALKAWEADNCATAGVAHPLRAHVCR